MSPRSFARTQETWPLFDAPLRAPPLTVRAQSLPPQNPSSVRNPYPTTGSAIRFTDFISAFTSSALPPGAAPALPAFPQSPPIGFAAEQSSKGLDLQIIIPGAALKGIGDYVKQLSGPKAPPRAQRAAPPQIEKILPVRSEPK